MEKELREMIIKNRINPYENTTGSGIITEEEVLEVHKTPDAKAIHKKVLNKIAGKYSINNTKHLQQLYQPTPRTEVVRKRQEYWKRIIEEYKEKDNNFLKEMKVPRKWWKPKYGIIVITEEEETYMKLNKEGIPAQLIIGERDLMNLENYEIVQVLECDNYKRVLENLPQTVFYDSIEEVYLERFLEILSGWKENIELIKNNDTNERIREIINELVPIMPMLENNPTKKVSKEEVEETLETINEGISDEMRELNLTGTAVMTMMSSGKMPKELMELIEKTISETTKNKGIPEHLYQEKIPVTIDYEELERFMKIQDAEEHTNIAEEIKKHSETLRRIPVLLRKLEIELLIYDYNTGMVKFLKENNRGLNYPIISEELVLINANNIMISKPQPISFHLNNEHKCSMLTGANSGGKTTLIEHLIQIITMYHLGIPIQGMIRIPHYEEVYYFAKQKGATNKGAFENLLTQMASINPRNTNKTLILADEIEAVTEPGIAGKIINATAEYFINKGVMMIIATHLGVEIQKTLPLRTRIDGIEAKGLDENNELIVDHNPVIGRLANSTPELIVEKMALKLGGRYDYYKHLHERLKKV